MKIFSLPAVSLWQRLAHWTAVSCLRGRPLFWPRPRAHLGPRGGSGRLASRSLPSGGGRKQAPGHKHMEAHPRRLTSLMLQEAASFNILDVSAGFVPPDRGWLRNESMGMSKRPTGGPVIRASGHDRGTRSTDVQC